MDTTDFIIRIGCKECGRWIPAEEYAYGHDCEESE